MTVQRKKSYKTAAQETKYAFEDSSNHEQHRTHLWSEVTGLTARQVRVAPTVQVQVWGLEDVRFNQCRDFVRPE